MATVPDSSFDARLAAPRTSETGVVAFIDKWIFVFMAGLFVLTALIGFVPSSIGKTMAVSAGARPPFPVILHVHAVLMGSWLILLLTQTVLMATGRPAHHRKLGLAGFVLMPAMIFAGVALVPVMLEQLFTTLANPALPPPVRQELEALSAFAMNILLQQTRTGLLFALFVGLALQLRRTDFETHKRLMILATIIPLGAAIDRIIWLPTTVPASSLSIELYSLLWISPMLLWDLYRRRRLPKAYVIWLCGWLPTAVIVNQLWNTPWWQATARGLLGVG